MMNLSDKRYGECQAKANELEYDLNGLSRDFKKMASRLDHIENCVGMYSGKDRLL